LTSATIRLDCYQNEKHESESRTENHSHSGHRRIRYDHGAVKVTKSAFYSNHITLARPIAISLLKSNASQNTNWEK